MPNNVNFSFSGAEGESVLMALSQKGIYVSTGSACASRSLEPSHILLALGLTHEEAHCSVRFTLGKQTTNEDINYVLKVLPETISRLRKISGK
jgi:cysteine desulfurase